MGLRVKSAWARSHCVTIDRPPDIGLLPHRVLRSTRRAWATTLACYRTRTQSPAGRVTGVLSIEKPAALRCTGASQLSFLTHSRQSGNRRSGKLCLKQGTTSGLGLVGRLVSAQPRLAWLLADSALSWTELSKAISDRFYTAESSSQDIQNRSNRSLV